MLGERIDQLTGFCERLMVFHLGTEVSLIIAFNISAGKVGGKITPTDHEKWPSFSVVLFLWLAQGSQ